MSPVKLTKYSIQISGRHTRIVTDTLAGLIDYFGYTLEIGASWDKRVNRQPKNIRSFVSSLQRAYTAKEARCYNRTSVGLAETQSDSLTPNTTSRSL